MCARFFLPVSQFISFLGAMAICLHSTAQPASTLRLKPGQSIFNTTWRDSIYRFPEFLTGRVIFISGPSPAYKMNYVVMTGEMEFLDSKGDTLQLTRSPDVKLVNIGGHVFYHDLNEGYIEVVLQQRVALGVKRAFVLQRKEIESSNGYATTSRETGAVSSYRGASRAATSNSERVFTLSNVYYFIDAKNVAHPASKASLQKLFPDHRDPIKAYLKDHDTDFGRKADLVALLMFCNAFETDK